MKCIKCDGNMPKVTFSPVNGQRIECRRCGDCNGVWIEREALDQYLDQGSWGIDSWAVDSDLMRDLDEKMARCPRCDLRMIKAPSNRNRAVTIDFCDACASVWLDPTELDQLETPNGVSEGLVDRFLGLIGRS